MEGTGHRTPARSVSCQPPGPRVFEPQPTEPCYHVPTDVRIWKQGNTGNEHCHCSPTVKFPSSTGLDQPYLVGPWRQDWSLDELFPCTGTGPQVGCCHARGSGPGPLLLARIGPWPNPLSPWVRPMVQIQPVYWPGSTHPAHGAKRLGTIVLGYQASGDWFFCLLCFDRKG